MTVAEEALAFTSCAIEFVFVSFTVIMCFLASLAAFSMASEISLAFPVPTPTLPFRSPMIIATLKEKRRPPATTRATRRTSIDFCSYSGLTRSGRPRPSRLSPGRPPRPFPPGRPPREGPAERPPGRAAPPVPKERGDDERGKEPGA